MTHTEFLNNLASLKGNEQELRNFVWNLAGDANKVLRQSMMEVLTGDRLPLVKCGINALYAECLNYINALPVVTEEPVESDEPEFLAFMTDFITEGLAEADQERQPEVIDFSETESEAAPVVDNAGSLKEVKLEVGMKVVRKKCQRKGEITAIEGLTVTVTLEDGSKRRPCLSRFRKLYLAA